MERITRAQARGQAAVRPQATRAARGRGQAAVRPQATRAARGRGQARGRAQVVQRARNTPARAQAEPNEEQGDETTNITTQTLRVDEVRREGLQVAVAVYGPQTLVNLVCNPTEEILGKAKTINKRYCSLYKTL